MHHHRHLVRRRVFVVESCADWLPQMRRFHLCVSAGGDLLQFLLASHCGVPGWATQVDFEFFLVQPQQLKFAKGTVAENS